MFPFEARGSTCIHNSAASVEWRGNPHLSRIVSSTAKENVVAAVSMNVAGMPRDLFSPRATAMTDMIDSTNWPMPLLI